MLQDGAGISSNFADAGNGASDNLSHSQWWVVYVHAHRSVNQSIYLSLPVYPSMHTHIRCTTCLPVYMYVYKYRCKEVYIYIQRERERERERYA